MESELDRFDDVIPDAASKNARAGGKFHPRVKPRPGKKSSVLVSSTESFPTVSVSENEFTAGAEKGPFSNGEDAVGGYANVNLMHALSNGEDTFTGDADVNLANAFIKSGGENGEIFLQLESFDGFFPQSTNSTEIQAVHAFKDGNTEERSMDPKLCNHGYTSNSPDHQWSPDKGTLTDAEADVLIGNGDFLIETGAEEMEDAEVLSCLETQEIVPQSISTTGRKSGKFKPKPKVQSHASKQSSRFPNSNAIKSISYVDEGTCLVPSQMEYIDASSIPSVSRDDGIDFSSAGIDDSTPTNSYSNSQLNEEPTDLAGTSCLDAAISEEHHGAFPVLMGQGFQASRCSERLRKQRDAIELVDDDEFVPENNVDDADGNYAVEFESLDKRTESKSRKPIVENKSPVRKRNKTNGAAEKLAIAPKKKFSHSTRRSRKRGNPDLLKIPEDEIDLQNLPMKDLIWLAEHKERLSKNGTTTSKHPLKNQSAAGFSSHCDEDGALPSAQGRDTADEQEDSMIEETIINYGTYMKITPRLRWSKQDTEMFYEAVHQFGSDLMMIKECFPGRTREQIRSKYKSEGRRNPLRLHDALTTRARDHSHFQVVMERLQQNTTQKKDSDGDEPAEVEEETEEAVADANGQEREEMVCDTSGQQMEEKVANTNEDSKNSETQLEEEDGPRSKKSEDSEDEFYLWSLYKSEI